MRNAPRWLRPVLGMLLALAVGVAGCLIASQFAPRDEPQVITVEPLETTPAQVIEPSSVGDEPVTVDESDLTDTSDWSESTGTVDVVAEPYEGLSVDDRAVIAAMNAADDPVAVVEETEDLPSAADYGITVYGDPCGSASPPPGADCPDPGIHSVILPLVPEILDVEADAYPPRYEDDPRSRVTCPATPEVEGSVPFGVATTEPVHITLRFYPRDSRTAPDRVVQLDPDPTAVANWEAAVSGARGYVWISTCTVLPDLEPGVEYYVNVRAERAIVDGDGDIATMARSFTVGELDLRPPTIVQPIGSSLLYVAAYHEDDVDSRIVARLDVDGTGECEGSTLDYLTRAEDQTETIVDFDWARASGYSWEFNRRSQVTFFVPEGEQIVVCVLQERDGAPSWATENPYRSERFIVQSPDRAVPTLTVESAAFATGVQSATISASTTEGQFCGAAFTPRDSSDPATLVGQVLCDQTMRHSELIGSDGDIAIHTYVTAEDVDYETALSINLSDLACLGSCELPESYTYTIPLATVTVHRGICSPGLFESSCTPPATDVAAGVVVLRATWEQGAENGRSRWWIDQQPTVETTAPESEFPRMDTSETVHVVSRFDGLPDDYVNAQFVLTPDRPVDYFVRLEGPCEREALRGRPATTREVTGRTSASTVIEFANLCFGTRYSLIVVLTDDAGNVTTYTERGTGEWESWRNGYLTTPNAPVPLAQSVTLESTDDEPRVITSVEVWSSGRRVGDLEGFAGHCMSGTDDAFTATAEGILPVAGNNVYELRIHWIPADDPECHTAAGDETMLISWSHGGDVYFFEPPRVMRMSNEGTSDPFEIHAVLEPAWP